MGIREEKAQKGFLTPNGCEAESNGGTMKIVLRKSTITQLGENPRVTVVYRTTFFVKDEGSWMCSDSDSSNFDTVRDFVLALRQSPEFTEATKELDNQLKQKENYEK